MTESNYKVEKNGDRFRAELCLLTSNFQFPKAKSYHTYFHTHIIIYPIKPRLEDLWPLFALLDIFSTTPWKICKIFNMFFLCLNTTFSIICAILDDVTQLLVPKSFFPFWSVSTECSFGCFLNRFCKCLQNAGNWPKPSHYGLAKFFLPASGKNWLKFDAFLRLVLVITVEKVGKMCTEVYSQMSTWKTPKWQHNVNEFMHSGNFFASKWQEKFVVIAIIA